MELSILFTGIIVFCAGRNLYKGYGAGITGVTFLAAVMLVAILIVMEVAGRRLLAPYRAKQWRLMPLLFACFFILVFLLIGMELKVQYFNTASSLGVVNAEAFQNAAYRTSPSLYACASLYQGLVFLLGEQSFLLPMQNLIVSLSACFFLYLTARKLGGRAAGVIALGIVFLLPTQYADMAVINPTLLVTAVLFLELWLSGEMLSFEPVRQNRKYQLLMSVFMGITGAILLFLEPVMFLFMVGIGIAIAKEKGIWNKLFTFLYSILSIGGFAALLYVNHVDPLSIGDYFLPELSYFSGTSFLELLSRLETVITAAWIPFSYPDILQASYLILLFLTVCALLYGFLKHKRYPVITFGFFTLFLFSIYNGGKRTYITLLVFLAATLTGNFISSLFQKPEEEVAEMEAVEEPEPEFKPLPEPEAQPLPEPVVEAPEPPKVKFLENPLPEPKRHVPRTFDFDIPISEDDDFDL